MILNGSTRKNNRYGVFGFFRLLLALLVMCQHAPWLAPLPLGDNMPKLLTGDIGVLTFFVLSGFIITEASTVFYNRRPREFISNRTLRIFPPLLFALSVSILVHALFNNFNWLHIMPGNAPKGPPQDIFSVSNILSNVIRMIPLAGDIGRAPYYQFIPYAWAIRVEFDFYIAVMIALILSKHHVRLSNSLVCLAIASIFASMAFHFGLAPSTFRFFIYFALGGTTYFICCKSYAAIPIGVLLLLLCLFDFSSYDLPTVAALSASGPNPRIAQYAILISCICAIPLLYYIQVSNIVKIYDQDAGDVSYHFYVNQYVVIVALYSIFGRDLRAFASSWFIVLLLSSVADRLIEPILRPLRDRIRGARVRVALSFETRQQLNAKI